MGAIICLLRGVNVGGRNKLPMQALRTLLESLRLRDADTYVQSGNAVFRATEANLTRLAERIEDAIERKFRFRPTVILRTAAELKAAVARNPFPRQAQSEPGKLLVMFLAEAPGKDAKEILAKLPRGREEMKLAGRELFIFFPGGVGQSKLPWATLGRALGTGATGRNWRTVTKLLEMAEDAERDR